MSKQMAEVLHRFDEAVTAEAAAAKASRKANDDHKEAIWARAAIQPKLEHLVDALHPLRVIGVGSSVVVVQFCAGGRVQVDVRQLEYVGDLPDPPEATDAATADPFAGLEDALVKGMDKFSRLPASAVAAIEADPITDAMLKAIDIPIRATTPPEVLLAGVEMVATEDGPALAAVNGPVS